MHTACSRSGCGARLPVEPRLPHQPLEQPAVDVAAVVVPNVEVGVMRVLAYVLAARVHRPEVHGAVAIAREVDASLPHHRRSARAVIVGGPGLSVFRVWREAPDVLCGAAAIAFRVAALPREPCEVQ